MAFQHYTRTVSATTGIRVVQVSPGKSYQLGAQDLGAGAVYNLIAYMYTADEKATRLKHVLEAGVSGDILRTAIAGFVELGIEVTTASSGIVEMELLECKLSSN